MSEDIISENKEMREKCLRLEEKLEEFKIVQRHINKFKNEINSKKSNELAKLLN